MSTLIDRIAATVGIWALTRLFGGCEPPYEPGCIACQAAKMVYAMREIARGE